jgi:hypothetical protein
MKLLHIGGPLDGKRQDAPDTPYFRAASFASSTYDLHFTDPLAPVPIHVTSYVRRKLRREDGTCFDVAVDTDKGNKDVLDLLVKGYRGHRNPKRRYPGSFGWRKV